VHKSEHGLSAVISQRHRGEPWSITGPSPYADTTEPLPAFAGTLLTPKGWWGIVVHCARGTHPQTVVSHFEPHLPPIRWHGQRASIGLYRMPNRELIVSSRIQQPALDEMIAALAEDLGTERAETRFDRRRVPAGVRYLPGQQLQLWFSL